MAYHGFEMENLVETDRVPPLKLETFALPASPLELWRYRYLKRSVDLLGLVLLVPFLPILFLIIAFAVWATSKGPIFFGHSRLRAGGATFTMWKFRTMYTDSHEALERYLASHPGARAEWQQKHKLREDPRITSVGRFLRKTSLDELPQFWNVFRGTMSLVGPRPITSAEVSKYGEHYDHYRGLQPGITGLWQVSGRSKLNYAERVLLDVRYAQEWSLRKDLLILVKTLKVILHLDGAY
jgi:lipopolysaccharide/colanic/teichoic acid biosynthesis glycosyltransferase